jgi:2-methylaconitate cis-trans-isomerase PrpF
MTDQRDVPFLHMRGGTSKGPVFLKHDLPEDRETLAELLLAIIGTGHPLNIDGIGGGNAVTTKIPILSRSEDGWADVDYFFVQLQVMDRAVDFTTTCGNMLTTVGPAALELGLVEPQGDRTEIRIRAVNTGGRFVSTVETPGGRVVYGGDTAIDGVPGTGAPVALRFMDITGSKTGSILPTGRPIDVIDGVEVTCMDVTMPVAIMRATDLGITGGETREELDADADLFARMEAIRLQAGELMGLGDVSKSVAPKLALLSPAAQGGTMRVRYFMPWQTHPTLAATSSQCIAACVLTPGTVADGLGERPERTYAPDGSRVPIRVRLEHPLGAMDVTVDIEGEGTSTVVHSAEILRTARKLTSGVVHVPAGIWEG